MKRRLPLTLAVCLGVLLGLGAATFRYAEGFAYFSNDPRACANCHVMRDYLDSWQKSSHHARAACNDCHTPHSHLPKYGHQGRERLEPLGEVHPADLPGADADHAGTTPAGSSTTASPATRS